MSDSSLKRYAESFRFVPHYNAMRFVNGLLASLELNPRVLDNAYWHWPVADDGHGEWVQAGRGVPSSKICGKVKGTLVCHHIEHHKGIVINGVDFTGKSAVSHDYYHCKNPLCPICFARGYAVREAQVIEGRIAEGVERGYGAPEHIALSPPRSLRGLPVPELVKLAEVACKDRGITGYSLLFHGRRMDMDSGMLVWSPHFHLIGFVAGGFDVCRGCVHNREDCDSCKAFKGREVRGYKKDGWIAKVEPRRKSIFGSAYYVLHHVSVRVGLRRFQRVRWCGLLGRRNFKSVKPKVHVDCLVCKTAGFRCEAEHEAYWGAVRLHEGLNAVPDFDSEGLPNFPSSVERVSFFKLPFRDGKGGDL